MKAYTYILFSESAGRYYTGSCDDLKKRFKRQNSSGVRSTRYGVPWALRWYRELPIRSEARRLELKIKKRGAKRFLEGLSKET
ncbi:GIY-YIG nuclease family protein [Rhodohalobacter sp.]|uniref:GIY-YIG nuclease family protein n=1 Tax=Rhodohalobacter sp. TaxID=1974210 RepID=UPI002ACEEFF3|nr:GIY-YIG nuclease family protein [Rhodohalobacter sp.]MDZ7757232.1 GIY-YIG nuclease family protein [Rhodohalobacter sp.]